MFRNLISMLADKYHVVAPDFPGYGESSAPSVNDFDYSYERLATVTEKFTEKLSLFVTGSSLVACFKKSDKHDTHYQSCSTSPTYHISFRPNCSWREVVAVESIKPVPGTRFPLWSKIERWFSGGEKFARLKTLNASARN